ncbi:MAG: PEP-CTERM sorting domain-containing protein [Myxococcota bacterium]|nr:PEP-CTERM sorting domain-containing protein [Myxococcota bacterium]
MAHLFASYLCVALTCMAIYAPQAGAVATYAYTGDFFDEFQDSDPPEGSYTSSMRVTGSFSLATELPADLPWTDIGRSVIDFSFADGRSVLTDANTLESGFFVSTDAMGRILNWAVYLDETGTDPDVAGEINRAMSTVWDGVWDPSDSGGIAICVAPGSTFCDLQGDRGESDTPGTWTLIPEPSAAALLGFGLLATAVVRRKARGPIATARLAETGVDPGRSPRHD